MMVYIEDEQCWSDSLAVRWTVSGDGLNFSHRSKRAALNTADQMIDTGCQAVTVQRQVIKCLGSDKGEWINSGHPLLRRALCPVGKSEQ